MDTVVKSMLEDDDDEPKDTFRRVCEGITRRHSIIPFLSSDFSTHSGNPSFRSKFNTSAYQTVRLIIDYTDREGLEQFACGLVIFGRDISKIPCFRESFMYGIATGIGVGIASFIKTSKPMLSQHVAVGAFSISTLAYWSYCRVQWSRQKFDAQLLQEHLKEKVRYEGTAVEKELEERGILKSA